jgi:DNA repair exonuclease SbcCD ATPase subunit
MSDITGDKNYIENLLKALSVPEAIKIFSEIEKRIMQLLNCSSDDFLSLNDHFKSYHKESKNIANNASNIIQIITDNKINNSFADLKRFCDSFNTLTLLFSQHVEFIDVEIKKASNKFESLKIVQNNYKQNIVSLKVLLSSAKMAVPNSKELLKRIEEAELSIEHIKKRLGTIDEFIEQFVTVAQESLVLLSNIKKENYQNLQKLNDNIEVSFSIFRKKYDEASQLFPELKEQTDKNAQNIAKIITNLQYHDIIRQKIEHIQRTHKDIVADLSTYKENEVNTVLLHNKAKTFLKIRDVAGLQAAQLLHANKQYEMAIEEIGLNLEEIGNEMVTISSHCENLVGKSQTKEYYLNNIVENLNNALNYNNKLWDFINNIKQHTQELSDKNKHFSNIFGEIQIEKSAIKESVFGLTEIKNNDIEAVADQIQKLLKETDTLEIHIQEIHKDLLIKIDKLVNPKENFLTETNILQSLNELSTTIPGLIELLKNSIKKIDEYLYFNSGISLNISDNIKNSLKKIKYYDLFEKACEKIVEDLNSINLKLNYGTGSVDLTRTDNLKHLKDRYTMASEHIIHEHISHISNISDLSNAKTEEFINLVSQNSETDDDNLELF